jgi:hypothetical protein
MATAMKSGVMLEVALETKQVDVTAALDAVILLRHQQGNGRFTLRYFLLARQQRSSQRHVWCIRLEDGHVRWL